MAHTRTPSKPVKSAAKPVLASPPEARLTPEDFAQENRQTDRLLTFLLVCFAFLLASFPIVDARFWQSLRTGQLIDAGEFVFGADPYCYTTAGQTWVHPGWLADYFFFRVYEACGGAGLVLFRGLVMLLLTLLLLSFQKQGRGLMTLITVMLAAMAMAPRLWVRPELFTVLFLGITLYLLNRPAEKEPKGWLAPLLRLTQGRWFVFLPPLFALWANLDDWFILGPLLTLAWWAGSLLEPTTPGREASLTPAEKRSLLIVLLVGVAACALNPYHVRAFKLPGELWSPAMNLLAEKFPSRKIGVSPFSAAYFGAAVDWLRPLGLTYCEWAYYLLVAAGIGSFLANQNYLRVPRLAVWLGFFALSAWEARNAAFFAVVGGGIAVMNLNDWLTAPRAPPPASRRRVFMAMSARLAMLLVLVFGVFLCLQRSYDAGLRAQDRDVGNPNLARGPFATESRVFFSNLISDLAFRGINPRGSVGWSAFADPSLRQAAEWRHGLGEATGRAFHLSFAEASAYEAWFNPGGKTMLDQRFELHGAPTAEDYLAAYQALRDTPLPRGSGAPDAEAIGLQSVWQTVFRKYDISHVVVSARGVKRGEMEIQLYALLSELLDAKIQRQFELLDFVDGNNFIFAWTGSPHFEKLKRRKQDPDAMAFRRPQQPPPVSEPPLAAAQLTPLGLALEGAFTRKPTGLDGAAWWLEQHDKLRMRGVIAARTNPYDVLLRVGSGLMSQAAGLSWGPPLPTDVLSLERQVDLERRTPAMAYLALAQARQAIAAASHRSDTASLAFRARGYFHLARAYEAIYDLEQFGTRGAPLPLREFQITAALRQAAECDPNDPELRDALARRYLLRRGQQGQPEPYLDEGVLHFRIALELMKARGKMRIRPGAPPTPMAPIEIENEHKHAVDQLLMPRLGKRFDELEKLDKSQRAQFEQQAPKKNAGPAAAQALQRAGYALQLGLVGQAEAELRDALGGSDPTVLRPALSLMVEVCQGLGLVPELLEKLKSPLAEQALGEGRLLYITAMAAAAAGDPAKAAEARAELATRVKEQATRNLLAAGQYQLVGRYAEPLGSSYLGGNFSLTTNLRLSQQLGEQFVMQGLHRLEQGDPAAAALLFRTAIREVDPISSYARLAGRYYFLITGEFLDADLQTP